MLSPFHLTLRSLRRDPGYAFINGVGLAVALAACILIALFVRNEFSYDRFHQNADRTVVLGLQNEAFDHEKPGLSTSYAIGGALADDVAGVEAAVRMTYGSAEEGVFILGDTPDDRHETGGFYTDPTFFQTFTTPVVAGDGRDPLADPTSMVVTAPVAERVFGSAAGAVGQTRQVIAMGDTLTFTVRAVVEAPPAQSSLQYGALMPMRAFHESNPQVSKDWGGAMYRTFALLRPGVAPAAVEAAANRLSQAEIGSDGEDDGIEYVAVPLTAFRLSDLSHKEGFRGSLPFLQLFGAIALLILALSAINYVNLATARASQRAREVGVRKALGAARGSLIAQFLRESIALTLAAALVGVALAALALPWFNGTFGTELTLGALDVPFWVGLVGGAVVVGVLAGLYPAVYLSRFSPSRVLAGAQATGAGLGAGGTRLRRSLVVLQFASAVALLTLTGAVTYQLNYMRSTPLGFEPEGLVGVTVSDPAIAAQTEAMKAAFTASPAVDAAAGTGNVPPSFWHTYTAAPDPAQSDLELSYSPVDADADLADVLGLGMAAGRWFDRETPSDAADGAVVSEGFVRALGYSPAEAIGKTFDIGNFEGQRVIGVVRDFHHASLREPIQSVSFAPNRPSPWDDSDAPTRYREIAVRLVPGREAEGMAHLETVWAQFSPDTPILMTRVADEIAALSEDEAALARVFGLFAIVALVIAGLGLVGLAAYTAERRRRELGIRKVLGASVGGLMGLLSREYVVLAVVASLIAAPVAVILVRRWLERFAYHAPFNPMLLVGSALVLLTLALASVGVQAYRAATADPVRALRSE